VCVVVEMSLYLKWTAEGRVPSYQGGKPIPVNRWTARVADPILCEAGWHACRWEDVSAHIAAELWVCELDGIIIEGDDKVVAERLKLVERAPISASQFRHFAADCAESVLHLFEQQHQNDDRPRKAIEAAHLFADGLIGRQELDAARDAALAAAWAAAGDAARAAAGAAAWAAARDAAGAAARAAAGAAAWDAARAAAWDAARAAAWAAARAAAEAAQSDLLLDRLGLDPALFAHRGNR